MNLLEETKIGINESGHNISDILFIGSEKTGHQCTWDQFKKIADFEYDNGFGSAGIAMDLIIVFGDAQQMTRNEYDGSEGWDYTTKFALPATKLPITCLGGDDHLWVDLADIN